MTIRTRLSLGFLAIAVVLVIPLILALRALERMHDETVALRDNEFAASLLLGRIRLGTEDLRGAETALLFFPSDTTQARMSAEIDTLSTLADSLEHYQLDSAARNVRLAVQDVAQHAPIEYRDALAKRADDAQRTSDEHIVPAMVRIERSAATAERSLRQRTIARVNETANAASDARQLSAVALALAALLAAVIAIGITRSITHPVRDLERGMAAVASGDFDHKLGLKPTSGTEFSRLAASFAAMSQQLAELDKLKAEFVSVASHELKTPINVVIGYLQLIDEGVYGPLTPKQREICRTIENQAQALSRLVKQLLDVSRFDAGGSRIEPRAVDLPRFLEELERTFDVLARQRGITFRVTRAADLPAEVHWDSDRMNEVMGNLLSNAFKFTKRNGTVELIAESSAEGLHIQVRDTGAGIPPDELPLIFEKFFQAGNQSQAAQEGTGLGLAIAKQIVEAHGGIIEVESAPGVGTTFTLTFPKYMHPDPTANRLTAARDAASDYASRARQTTAVIVAFALLAGCASPQLGRSRSIEATTTAAANASAWAATLVAAQRDVERGRHADAERTLREYGERNAPSPEAVETMYWRAVFMLDPASSAGSTREALALLAKYLEADVPLPHRTEALVLQRVATALAAPRETGGAARSAASEAEMKALKDELEQTKAELERIKKRLAPASPPPTPPPAPTSADAK